MQPKTSTYTIINCPTVYVCGLTHDHTKVNKPLSVYFVQ